MNIKTKKDLIQAANTLYQHCLRNPTYTDCDRNGCPFYIDDIEECALNGNYPMEWDMQEVEQEGI